MPEMQKHQQDVSLLQDQVRDFYERKIPFRVDHGGSNSTRTGKKKGETLRTSHLDGVLEVNIEAGFALVEPNVSMRKLVDATLPYGLVPPVVMEFPEITVGGGIQGGAGESSSFKHGCFHDICEEYEIILGSGELVRASASENSDLFFGTACSYGSLGVLTLIKVRLIPAKPFVRLLLKQTSGNSQAVTHLETAVTQNNVDFIDGILFGPREGVVMLGSFSEHCDLPLRTFSKKLDDWFYLQIQKDIREGVPEILIPLKDYLFRYDRAGFWAGKYAFKYFKLPQIKLVRRALAAVLTTKRLYRVLHATHVDQSYIIQDITVPRKNTDEFLKYLDNHLGIYPLWLCPLRIDTKAFLSPSHLKDTTTINVGIWGEVKNAPFYETNRMLEREVLREGARKVLYAHSYFPEEEFWQIYDKEWYGNLRAKYHAQTLPSIFERVYVRESYRPQIVRGLWNLVKEHYSS